MLPAVPQTLPAVMYIQPVTECSRPSAEAHIDSIIPAVPHVLWKPNNFYNAFSSLTMWRSQSCTHPVSCSFSSLLLSHMTGLTCSLIIGENIS